MLIVHIKQTLFYLRNNIVFFSLINVGFYAVAALAVFASYSIESSLVLSLALLSTGVLVLSIYAGAAAQLIKTILEGSAVSVADFAGAVAQTLSASLLIGGIGVAQILLIAVVFPFYMVTGGIAGLTLMSLLFWISLSWWLASQYYWPLVFRFGTNKTAVVRKCVVLLRENTGFTLGLGTGAAAILLVSGVSGFLFPGLSGVLLWHQVGINLKIQKSETK